jgi:peptide deformylase
MSRLEIIEFPDRRLRTVAKPVEVFDRELGEFIDDMIETMYAADGIGLAATQVNVHKQVLVMDVSESRDQPKIYINPQILSSQGSETCEEGCLSVPGIYAEVKRAETVLVRAHQRDGSIFEEELSDMHAVCIQHEMDHLKGKLFVDYLSPLKQRMVRKKLEKQRRQESNKAARARL